MDSELEEKAIEQLFEEQLLENECFWVPRPMDDLKKLLSNVLDMARYDKPSREKILNCFFQRNYQSVKDLVRWIKTRPNDMPEIFQLSNESEAYDFINFIKWVARYYDLINQS